MSNPTKSFSYLIVTAPMNKESITNAEMTMSEPSHAPNTQCNKQQALCNLFNNFLPNAEMTMYPTQ